MITKEEIQEFLDSDKEEIIDLDFTKGWAPIQEVLLLLGYNELEFDEDDTNGWDVSFWYTWKHDTLVNLTVSGSLHSGDFKLYKDTDEE